MAHDPENPALNIVELDLTEDTAIFICDAEDELDVTDLIPNTAGDVDAAPTLQVSRVDLHNGLDFVSPGALRADAFTFTAYLPDRNAKMRELENLKWAKKRAAFNVFNRDGSGVKGYAYITHIATAAEGDFQKQITVEPFAVERIPAPTTGG